MLTLCLAMVASMASHAQSIPLEQGVVWSVGSVRTWESFDGASPGDKPYEKWKSSTAVSYKSHRYTPDQRVPEGKFVEILVWLDAEGGENAAVDMIPAEGDTLDAKLMYGEEQSSTAKAFGIPGTGDAENRCFIETWEGNLNFSLESGERTWILLLFDIPGDISEAKLQLKSSDLFPVTIPE